MGKRGGGRSAIHCGEGWVGHYNLYVVELKYWTMDIYNSCIKIQLQIQENILYMYKELQKIKNTNPLKNKFSYNMHNIN